MPFGDPGPYPIPALSTANGIGPVWLKFHQFQPAYAEVTEKHEYEDGGASFQTANDTGPIRWAIEYDGLSAAEVAVLDAHRNDAMGEVYGFDLTNPRTSVTYTDVHFDEGWSEDHQKTWVNSRAVRLIKRP